MNVAIKICGIKTPQMVQFCAQQGAQYIGIICCPTSPRYVDLTTGIALADAARQSGIIPVAVFRDEDATMIVEFCEQTGVTYVQLHGEPAKTAFNALPHFLHKIYVNPENEDIITGLRDSEDFIMYDHPSPGSGQVIDWESIQSPKHLRFFLAGGLNADNVTTAIATTKPYAVDVSSGVESTRGEKSELMIKEFIEKVKHA